MQEKKRRSERKNIFERGKKMKKGKEGGSTFFYILMWRSEEANDEATSTWVEKWALAV